MGMEPAYTRNLQFEVLRGEQGDPDESIITDALKRKVEEELQGAVEGEEE